MKAEEVFTPTSFPVYTYVEERFSGLKATLDIGIKTGGTVLSVSGPSKSGKTVFIEKNVGRSNLIHIAGAGIKNPDDLWNRVLYKVGYVFKSESSNSTQAQHTVSVKVSGEKSALVVKAGAEGAYAYQNGHSSAEKHEPVIDLFETFLKEVNGSGLYLFIDDFHYIRKGAMKDVATQIKEAVRQGMSIIVAVVPYHSDDAIRSNPDLNGRITKLDFSYWSKEHLIKIAELGFEKLNATCPIGLVSRLADESAGSPQLMQTLCLNASFLAGLYERSTERFTLPNDESFILRVCKQAALSMDGSSVVSKMKEGPKTRGEARTKYPLKSGEYEDVYSIIIKAFKQNPPKLTLRYNELKERVTSLCLDGGPSGSSITSSCEQMEKFANESSHVVEWDKENEVFDILDPYLLYYIRWGFVE